MKKKLFVCLLLVLSLLITKNAYAETYEGEYSVEYLLKNYQMIKKYMKGGTPYANRKNCHYDSCE